MTEHTQFETNGVTVLSVPVASDSYDFKMKESLFLYPGQFVLTYKCPVIWDLYKKESWDWLTRGDWSIHAITPDITEQQAKVLVEKFLIGYEDYQHTNDDAVWYYECPVDSLHSLLCSKGIDPKQKNVLLIKEK